MNVPYNVYCLASYPQVMVERGLNYDDINNYWGNIKPFAMIGLMMAKKGYSSARPECITCEIDLEHEDPIENKLIELIKREEIWDEYCNWFKIGWDKKGEEIKKDAAALVDGLIQSALNREAKAEKTKTLTDFAFDERYDSESNIDRLTLAYEIKERLDNIDVDIENRIKKHAKDGNELGWYEIDNLPGANDPIVTVVDDTIYANTINIICGPSKSNKSCFSRQLAAEIGSGGTILGKKCFKNPVLYIDLEMRPNMLANYYRIQKKYLSITEDGVKWHAAGGMDKQMNIQTFEEIVMSYATEYNNPVIILDCWYALFDGDNENDAVQVQNFLRRLKRLTEICTIIYVAHTNKQGVDPNNVINAVSGSKAHGQICDTMITIYPANREIGEDYDRNVFVVGRSVTANKYACLCNVNTSWCFEETENTVSQDYQSDLDAIMQSFGLGQNKIGLKEFCEKVEPKLKVIDARQIKNKYFLEKIGLTIEKTTNNKQYVIKL